MKIFSIFNSIPVMIGLAVIFGIFIIKPAKAQNQPEKEKKKTVVLKVVSDKDGKTTIIDTTFTADDIDPDALKKMAKELHVEMKDLENEMKEIQVMVMANIPDSARDDFEEIHRGHMSVMEGGDFFRYKSRGETISDVIGDIPMDKVRNYSIKNTKYGKKIVIEIED
jgi:arginine decarboxylase-like protein